MPLPWEQWTMEEKKAFEQKGGNIRVKGKEEETLEQGGGEEEETF